MNDIIMQHVEALQDEMIKSIQRLVQIDSVEQDATAGMPFGEGVAKALKEALVIGESLGFSSVNLDNYMGFVQYGNGEDYVCAMGHVDVVPVGDGWKHPPFGAFIENGTIYGRGVLDNKGPIMACLYGLAALKNAGINCKHPIRIVFGCDEESGFLDLNYYLEKERSPLYGFTPDCKYPVVYSERGRAIIKISDDKEDLSSFFSFLNQYFLNAKNTGDRLGIDYSNPEYGIMEMRGYRLDYQDDRASFFVTLSYPLGITTQEIVERIRKKAEPYHLEVVLEHNYDPVVFDKNSPMIRALQESYEFVTNMDGTPVTTTGGTYAKACPGIVPFGPSFPGQKGIGHNPDEWMTVDDLVQNAKIYALALYKLAELS